MNRDTISSRHIPLAVAVVVGTLLSVRPAAGAVYNLKAASKVVAMPDGTPVLMWGFGLVDSEVSVPGPLLEVPPGDTSLTVNLTNQLPVPVSIVVPGVPAPLDPVWNDGSSGSRTNLAQRVVSFTHVAAANGGTATYQWNDLQPGTYLYHSGTQPAVQVQMGLYGAVKHDHAAGTAYPGVIYDKEAILLYSEIDPSLHAAVQAGTYGTPAYPSTVDYRPKYFLVNGQPFSGQPALPAGVNERVLLRLVNAGLRSIVPTTTGPDLQLVAEDGQPVPYASRRYAALLPAGKSIDALLVPIAAGPVVLFDRSLRMSDGFGAGIIARLDVAATQGAPVAADDSYTVSEGGTIDTVADSLAGVLANDTGSGLSAVLVSDVRAGTLALQPDGSFTYTPSAGFSGTDFFTYVATDGTTSSGVATVAIQVTPVNDPPVAVDDSYQASEGAALTVAAPGLLANDSDPDNDMLQVELVTGPTGGTLNLGTDGSFEYTPSSGTTQDSFTYRAFDGVAYSAPATVSIAVAAAVNAAPVAEADFASTNRNVAVTINVVANDWDPDGTVDPASVVLIDPPSRGGSVFNPGDGTLVFTPKWNFKGTDTFTYAVSDNNGLQSASAPVKVNVVK